MNYEILLTNEVEALIQLARQTRRKDLLTDLLTIQSDLKRRSTDRGQARFPDQAGWPGSPSP